jgi:hypothetical protein
MVTWCKPTNNWNANSTHITKILTVQNEHDAIQPRARYNRLLFKLFLEDFGVVLENHPNSILHGHQPFRYETHFHPLRITKVHVPEPCRPQDMFKELLKEADALFSIIHGVFLQAISLFTAMTVSLMSSPPNLTTRPIFRFQFMRVLFICCKLSKKSRRIENGRIQVGFHG